MVKLRVEGGRCKVQTPYYPKFNQAAKEIGGSWNNATKTHDFPEARHADVTALLIQHFDTSGRPQEWRVVRVDVQAYMRLRAMWSAVIVGGLLVVEKRDRDMVPRLYNGADLTGGAFYSRGGSRQYPMITGDCPIIEVGVPADAAACLAELYPDVVQIVQA